MRPRIDGVRQSVAYSIGAHFEESESRLDVKRTRWLISIYGKFGFQQRQLSRHHDVSFMIT